MARTETYRLWTHGSGIIYICWSTLTGTQRVSTGTKDLGQAERERARFIAGLDNPEAPKQPTITYILDRYYKDHGSKARSSETITHNINALKAFFGDLQPQHLSSGTLERYAKSRGKSDGTILRELGTLKAALRFGQGNRWIGPVPVFKMPVRQPPPKDRWLTKGQVRKLLEACKSRHQRLFIRLALSTAARTSAILELKWESVDFETGLISFGRGHGNKRRATVPMNGELRDALEEAQQLALTDYVIEYHGESIKRAYRAFSRLSTELGFKCSPHILRHTAATWMAMDGVELSKIARFLGDSEKTVERVYAKFSPDYLKTAISALELGKAA